MLAASLLALVWCVGCSAGGGEQGSTADLDVGTGADMSGIVDSGGMTDGMDSTDGSDMSDMTDMTDWVDSSDGSDAADGPSLSDPPAPKTYSAGTCPGVSVGSNTFLSGDLERQITVTLPSEPAGAGVLFLWHGFGDTHSNFSAAVRAQQISDTYNVITVSSQAAVDAFSTEKLSGLGSFKGIIEGQIGQIPPTWSILDGPELDLQLFDDLLSCIYDQYDADLYRIYSMGFSQGALWTSKLSLERSEYLAASVAWSGGLGNESDLLSIVGINALVLMDYETPQRPIPILTVSGTETDAWPNEQFLVVDFNSGTKAFSEQLRIDGVVNVYCEHDEVLLYGSASSFPELYKVDDLPDPLPEGAAVSAHTIPSDGMTWGLQFLFDHEWTTTGESKYRGYDGTDFPAYCTFPK